MTRSISARRPGMRFPKTPTYDGFNAPGRIEADIYELECDGEIPVDLQGRFYRVAPEPQFPPLLGDDFHINGDGMVSMFRFENGHVDFKSRYVRTEKFTLERAARRALFGAYRNIFTDDLSVRGFSRGTANTNIIWHSGMLLALKEDSPPVALDPDTLETVGEWTCNGRMTSRTFTAHPKFDPQTGNLYAFGYEARGLTTPDVAFYVIDAKGKIVREEWLQMPYTTMMHDFAVTREHVIFPVMPTTTDLERLKAGGPHWLWDPSRTSYYGIMPLDGGAADTRWFQGPARWCFHYYNAFTDGSKVIVDGMVSDAQTFPFMYPDTAGHVYDPAKAVPVNRRWTFNLASGSDSFEEVKTSRQYCEFGRIDERYNLERHRFGYAIANQPERDFTGGGLFGPAFNTISRYDFETGGVISYALDSNSTAQEAVFVPRSPDAPEGDGYLIALVNRYETMLSDLLILDARDLEAGPIATIKMPLRLRNAIHGNWVPEHALAIRASFG